MNSIYSLAIKLYTFAVYLASPFKKKAKLWIRGRKGWSSKLAAGTEGFEKTIWIHCSSLGEFEQGRPLIEKIKEEMPYFKVVLSFFSPSGYEIRKNYQMADYVCYLPEDTRKNARKFVETVSPQLVVFVKYEFWNNYISELHRKNIPVYLISGIFRKNQHFFRWYGKFFLDILRKFTHIFVQNNGSEELLRMGGINNITVTGDTRFDRVKTIAATAQRITAIEEFMNGQKVFLAGSTWPKDEEIIASYINDHPYRMKWIIAPHEPGQAAVERLEKMIRHKCARLSQFSINEKNARVLIIDVVGILSSAYRYAFVSAVGGGFGKGIHNILEPASWGTPVLVGPKHLKFREATDLITLKGAFCYRNYEEFRSVLDMLLSDTASHRNASDILLNYVSANSGATEKIFKILFEN